MKPILSLIIPAYNEEKRIENSLRQAVEYLQGLNLSWEILIVDDGSTDNTSSVASSFYKEARVIKLDKNSGKGAAVRRGMIESRGDLRVFSDADFSTPIYEIDKILRSIRNGADVCIGSRAVDYSMIKEHQPFYREFMGKTFNKIVQFLVLKGIKDTQCGFKGFTKKAVEDIFPVSKIDGFGFDVEILYLARKKGYVIAEVPVEWYNDQRSTVNPITDSIRMLYEISRIKKLHRD